MKIAIIDADLIARDDIFEKYTNIIPKDLIIDYSNWQQERR